MQENQGFSENRIDKLEFVGLCPDNELRLTARELTFSHELHFVRELPCGT